MRLYFILTVLQQAARFTINAVLIARLGKVSLLCLLFFPVNLFAHHSVDGGYDDKRPLEISGVVSAVHWRNPHVRFSVDVVNGNGLKEDWTIETISISTLRRRGVDENFMSIGDSIKVFGIASRNDPLGMHARNILVADKLEIILQTAGDPHWPEGAVKTSGSPVVGREGDSSSPELGIFRVWSFPTELTGKSIWKDAYPLTAKANALSESFDPNEPVTANCEPKGMPSIMEQPYPIEFVKAGNDIELHLEEYDTVRKITMSAVPSVDTLTRTKMGNSFGRWDGKVLAVTTLATSWRHLDGRGAPLSEDAVLLERFSPADDGSRLNYSIMITDPEMFTEPVTLEKYWWWFPESKVSPYNCEK